MNAKTIRALVYLVAFSVVTVFLTYVLAVTITNGSVSSTTNHRAYFTDTTSLLDGDDVRVAGVRVGQIKHITLQHSCPGLHAGQDATTDCSLVTFSLDKAIPLHMTAVAILRFRNLVGQRYLDIEQTPGGDAVRPADDPIPLTQTEPALNLTELFNGFRPLFEALTPAAVNSVAYEVVATLQGEGATLDSLLANTASLSTSVASQDAEIGSLITNLTGVLATVDTRDSDLTNLIDQLQRLVTGLAEDRAAIADSLSNVDALAVSTTTLLESIRPELPTDLSQLSGIANTLATTTVTFNGPRQNELDEFLNRFPSKITAITRTATYGSFFNFYLCHADIALGNVDVGGSSEQLNATLQSTNTAACGTGGS